MCLVGPSLPLLTTRAPAPVCLVRPSLPALLHLFPPPGFPWALLLHQVTATEVGLAHLFVGVSSDVLLGGGFGIWSWAWPCGEDRGSVVSGQAWGSQLYSWGLPLQLVMHRERTKGRAKTSGAGRGSNWGGLWGPCCALGGRHCGWELTESRPGAGIVSCRGGGGGPSCALG